MDQDKKQGSGAPSSDTTSALFVSARKKQLEQQETERRAQEKEAQRLAAEAEVRRLEAEVEERRRKAEEEKVKAEEEARRIAEEARASKEAAAANPDAVLGRQADAKESKGPKIPSFTKPQKTGGTSSGAKPAPNKNVLIFGGIGAVVVIALIIILVVTSGGGAAKIDPEMLLDDAISVEGVSISYPKGWMGGPVDHNDLYGLMITSDYENNGVHDVLRAFNLTEEYTVTEENDAAMKEIATGFFSFYLESYAITGAEQTSLVSYPFEDGWGVDAIYTYTATDTKAQRELYMFFDATAAGTRLGVADIAANKSSADASALMERIFYSSKLEATAETPQPAAQTPAPSSAPALDTTAAFDSSVLISSLSMNVHYPSSVFKVASQEEDSIAITTFADEGMIQIFNLNPASAYSMKTEDEVLDQLYSLNETYAKNYIQQTGDGELVSLEVGQLNTGAYRSEAIVHFTAESGRKMVMTSWISGWERADDGITYIFLFISVAEAEHSATIDVLAERVWNKMS